MPRDLSGTAASQRAGQMRPEELLEHCLVAADSPASHFAFIRRFPIQEAADPRSALAGLCVSVKDMFDVAGQPTTAGSRVLAAAAPATADCPAVARLRAAGATLIGHTNMSEFAFSGVGINPHHGTPLNPVTRALDGQARIPGGSSAGAAVSVATGAAWAALGSDTGGSIRIPAALQGLVGFKNTARLTPTAGSIPLSPSLDTVCAITHSVRDAVFLHEILAARRVALVVRPWHQWRLAVVKPLFQDELDSAVAHAFERALCRLRSAGASITEIDLPALQELPDAKLRGALTAAQAWGWHRDLITEHEALYDPRVALRIRRGATVSADTCLALESARARLISAVQSQLLGFDAVLSPTTPLVAPLLAPLLASDEAFFSTNALLLRNPAVVNAIDGCAISVPCHDPGEMPVGLMLWAPALQDDTLLSLALQVEPVLAATAQG